jgi:hypothetical protein
VTLVCSVGKPYPLLLGDLAITSRRRHQGCGGPFPTVGKALGPYGKIGGRYLAGLAQKVCVLGPRLAIGWAGRPNAARVFLEAARERHGSTGVERPEPDLLLAELGYRAGKLDGQDLSVVGMSLVDDHNAFMFSAGTHVGVVQDDPEFGLLTATGSGAGHLLRILPSGASNQNSKSLAQFNDHAGQILDPLALTLSRVLMYVAKAYVEEMISANTLKDFFDGGFEIALPMNGRIQKLSEVTYVFWFIERFDDSYIKFSAPLSIIKLSYVGQALIIRKVRIYGNSHRLKSGTMRSIEDRPSLYVVAPFVPATVFPTTFLGDHIYNLQSNTIVSCFILTGSAMARRPCNGCSACSASWRSPDGARSRRRWRRSRPRPAMPTSRT